MKIIIQCASSKWSNAPTLESNGIVANFVANPKLAPALGSMMNVAPDDLIGKSDKTWRDLLVESQVSKAGLMPAYSLYRPPIYSALCDSYKAPNIYILSAGWGLVNAAFLLPKYDITFSNQAESYKRRKRRDIYADFCHLNDGVSPAVFFGGKDYLPLLYSLLKRQKRRKIAFFRSAQPAKTRLVDGWELRPYVTPKLTNWHYDAAAALIAGRIKIG